jgi:hypothetical protein
VVRTGALCIDVGGGTVTLRGRPPHLRPRERRVLLELERQVGRAVGTDELLARIWGTEAGAAMLLQATVSRLRATIEPERGRPTYVRTVAGLGYRLERLPAAEPAGPLAWGAAAPGRPARRAPCRWPPTVAVTRYHTTRRGRITALAPGAAARSAAQQHSARLTR